MDIRFWGTSTRKPVIVLAQPDARYQPVPGPIRHVDDPAYVERLFDVVSFAERSNADFCVFPEFSWPLSAASDLRKRLRKLKTPGVYVLPFEHMLLKDYKSLLKTFQVDKKLRDRESAEIGEMMPMGQAEAWVNGALVAVKTADDLRVFPQRKLRPAELEEHGGLYSRFVKGRTIRYFRASNCTFAVLICFDFINRDLALLARPCDVLTPQDVQLDLLLIPECNPKPLHEFYLKTVIDLYQTPSWTQRRPFLVFNNVAAGTRLGSLQDASFGFTRIIGNLGSSPKSDEVLRIDGYVAYDAPHSLAEIRDKSRTIIKGKHARTLIFRPEQSVFRCDLPPLGSGAPRDRQDSSIDTHVEIFRPLGKQSEWLRVRGVPAAEKQSDTSVSAPAPAGFGNLEARFRKLVEHETLLVVRGSQGSGKTTLVSTTVRNVLRRDDRLVWLDLGLIEHTESALVEELLMKLGRASAVAYPIDRQYDELMDALRLIPTVVVLDSAESWGDDPLPEALLRLHGWKTLVVVASRFQPATVPESTRVMEVTPLTPGDFGNLVASVARVQLTQELAVLAFVMYVSSGGSALVAVWTGQYIMRRPEEAKQLSEFLSNAGVTYLLDVRNQLADAPIAVEDPREELEWIEKTEPPITLEGIFEWFKKQLNAAELMVLDVLCEMPSGLRTDDLALIAGRKEESVAQIIETLRDRNLVQTIGPENDTNPRHAQQLAHPFVRHLWSAANPTLSFETWQRIVEWARWVLDKYHPERDPRVSPINVNQWPNIAHVLRTLARGGAEQKRHFLELWRVADKFLWAAGRWRERLSFGREAEQVAREIGDVESEVRALYDAQAKTSWYRTGSADPAGDLLRRAAALAEASELDVLRADIEWYRSRMLLHIGENNEALTVARRAVKLADGTQDPGVQVRARIGLGNAYRETHDDEHAIAAYQAAAALLKNAHDADTEETRAVIDRNLGRVHLRSGNRAEAIRLLERAMARFHDLELDVQEAETAVYYAEALAVIGEATTARRHLEWGRQRLDPLGSVLRQQNIARAEKAIDEAMRRK